MNHFFNPIFLSWVLKSYLIDIDRLRKLNENELREHQNKCLKNIVKYAYSVQLYHEKYKKAGIHPSDIKGIEDIEKLPIVTKEDIKSYYPDGIISPRTQKKQLLKISTSGTTGK